MDQLESLSAALPDNVAQLAQLDELLQADPDNAELQAIRDDLQQVITTTLELQAQDALNKSAATGGAEAAAAAAAAGTVAAAAVPAASSHSYAAAPAVAALAAADLLHPYVSPLGADGLYPVGARVSAVYAKDGRSYLARVDSVDEGAETYRVTYLEYGQQATVPFEQVTPWRSATAEQLRMPNVPVKARWPEDGLFYAASLDGPSPDLPGHYVVRFGAAVGITGKKKKKVDVALHDIVLNEKFIDPRSLQLTSAASAAAKAAAAPLSEELVVPPHLVVHDTDSDAVKAGKLKKLKKLRYDHKRAWEAAQTDARKNSWLDFKAGKTVGGKKAKIAAAPGLAALQKPSMFATPDTIEGRVGVVGSGREMTEQTSLKRHVFDKSDASM